jgi:hypothetical protein
MSGFRKPYCDGSSSLQNPFQPTGFEPENISAFGKIGIITKLFHRSSFKKNVQIPQEVRNNNNN